MRDERTIIIQNIRTITVPLVYTVRHNRLR